MTFVLPRTGPSSLCRLQLTTKIRLSSSSFEARFLSYITDRGIYKKSDRKVWAFLGDGEMDEPESKGALTLASKEELDNLIFVVNCNLQRLDGPVRGNTKVIQELTHLLIRVRPFHHPQEMPKPFYQIFYISPCP